MQAHELRAGDEFRDDEGGLIYTVVNDAVPIGDGVLVKVRYAVDGGLTVREFDRDQEVSHVRPVELPKEEK